MSNTNAVNETGNNPLVAVVKGKFKEEPGKTKKVVPNRGKNQRSRKVKHGVYVDMRSFRIDRRTRVSKWIEKLKQELIEHLGGIPTVAERLLIEQICVKSMKAHLYHCSLFKGEKVGSTDFILAIQNSIRLDLNALGFQKRTKEGSPLDEYLKQKGEIK